MFEKWAKVKSVAFWQKEGVKDLVDKWKCILSLRLLKDIFIRSPWGNIKCLFEWRILKVHKAWSMDALVDEGCVQLIWILTIMKDEENLMHGGCRSVCLKEGCGGDPTRSVSQRDSAPALDCSWRARPAICCCWWHIAVDLLWTFLSLLLRYSKSSQVDVFDLYKTSLLLPSWIHS